MLNAAVFIAMPRVVMLNYIMLNVAFLLVINAALFIVMLRVVMLNYVMLNVGMQSVYELNVVKLCRCTVSRELSLC